MFEQRYEVEKKYADRIPEAIANTIRKEASVGAFRGADVWNKALKILDEPCWEETVNELVERTTAEDRKVQFWVGFILGEEAEDVRIVKSDMGVEYQEEDIIRTGYKRKGDITITPDDLDEPILILQMQPEAVMKFRIYAGTLKTTRTTVSYLGNAIRRMSYAIERARKERESLPKIDWSVPYSDGLYDPTNPNFRAVKVPIRREGIVPKYGEQILLHLQQISAQNPKDHILRLMRRSIAQHVTEVHERLYSKKNESRRTGWTMIGTGTNAGIIMTSLESFDIRRDTLSLTKRGVFWSDPQKEILHADDLKRFMVVIRWDKIPFVWVGCAPLDEAATWCNGLRGPVNDLVRLKQHYDARMRKRGN